MSHTNSPLATVKLLTKNYTIVPNKKIDRVTIHMAVGQATAKEILTYFYNNQHLKNSCNYAIGFDGSIGLCVEEKHRAWTSGNYENDSHAITIEVASEKVEPYEITSEAYNALVNLLVDICKRNNIPRLIWLNDSTLKFDPTKQNMTAHKWFQNTPCPGTYLLSKFRAIADDVNSYLIENNISVGDIVTIADGAVYTTGYKVPTWVIEREWIVTEVYNDGSVLINEDVTGVFNINSLINYTYLTRINTYIPKYTITFEKGKATITHNGVTVKIKDIVATILQFIFNLLFKERRV